MSMLGIEHDMYRWLYDLKAFTRFILLEDDIEYIDKCLISLFKSESHCQLKNMADSNVAINWIREYQKFKCSYALYPNKLNNLLIISVYMHCRNIEKAEYIVHGHLYRNGHTIFSQILKKDIIIDIDFIKTVNQYYTIK